METPITQRRSKIVRVAGVEYSVTEWTVDRFPVVLEDLIFLFKKFPVTEDDEFTKASMAKRLPSLIIGFLKDKTMYPTLRRVFVNLSGLPEDIPIPTLTEFLSIANAIFEVNDVEEVKERFFQLAGTMKKLNLMEMSEEDDW
jgi:hypothetical protein